MRAIRISLSLSIAGGILVSGVLSWRRSRHSKRVAKPRGKIPPATFLKSFECCPLLSPCFEPFDYPIRKSGVMIKGSFDVALGWIREFAILDKRYYCLMRLCSVYSQFPKEISFFLIKYSRGRVLHFEIHFLQNMSFEDFSQARILLRSGACL